MFRNATLAFALAASAASAGLAAGEVMLNNATEQRVRETLADQGYEVAKVKTEDGLFEAYARKDGQRLEVFLNSDYEVVRTKVDD